MDKSEYLNHHNLVYTRPIQTDEEYKEQGYKRYNLYHFDKHLPTRLVRSKENKWYKILEDFTSTTNLLGMEISLSDSENNYIDSVMGTSILVELNGE